MRDYTIVWYNIKEGAGMGVFKQLESEYDFDILEEFLGHFSMMCESMEPLIINLEKPEWFNRNIHELFRIFHNLKSSSGYLKITPINKLVTLAEEVLEECRELEGPASEDLINWLLKVSDQLVKYKNDLETDAETFSPLEHTIIKLPVDLVRD